MIRTTVIYRIVQHTKDEEVINWLLSVAVNDRQKVNGDSLLSDRWNNATDNSPGEAASKFITSIMTARQSANRCTTGQQTVSLYAVQYVPCSYVFIHQTHDIE